MAPGCFRCLKRLAAKGTLKCRRETCRGHLHREATMRINAECAPALKIYHMQNQLILRRNFIERDSVDHKYESKK